MISNIDELDQLCIKLFGKDNVSAKRFSKPDGTEITIHTGKSLVKIIEINVYKDATFMSFMHLDDDFNFEFEDEEKAFTEFEKYLQAVANDRIRIDGLSILGFKVTKRVTIF